VSASLPERERTQLERLVKIAKASAKLIDVCYEFGDPEIFTLREFDATLTPYLNELDDLLVEGGYRPPPPPPPTEEEIEEWVRKRVEDAHKDG
jgi:hypothetical protein